jgi:hypothetical protein
MGPTTLDFNRLQGSPRSHGRLQFAYDARQPTSLGRPGAELSPLDLQGLALQACSSSPAAQVTLNPLLQSPLALLGRSAVKSCLLALRA